MDIMELGAIGELVGGIGSAIGGVAVLVTLIYVGLQVQQSNRMEKAESIRSATRDYVTAMLNMDSDLFRRAVAEFGEMSKDDQNRAHTWLATMYSIAETEVALSRQDLAETGTMPPALASLLRSPGLSQWWNVVAPTFDKGFQQYVREMNAASRGEPALHEVFPWLSPDEPARSEVS